MTEVFSTIIQARRTRAVVAGLLVFCVLAGCKKKTAGGPSPNFPVQVIAAEAKRQPITETLSLVGTLAANEMVELKSEVDGTVLEIIFSEGQPVQKGDLLIRLEESKFAASLAEAEANLRLTQATFERNKQLLRDKLISQQEFDQAAALFHANEAAVALRKRLLQDARIEAPFAGITGARNVSPGQVISKDTTLTWIVDAETIKAEFNVPERFIGELKLGQPLELGVVAFQKEKFPGEVYFIAPRLDDQTRTVLVKARVPNPRHLLKPGMFANLDLTLEVRQNAVVIPESAVMLSSQGASVWIQGADGLAELRPVRIGLRLPGRVEVVSGLNGGEIVVAEGVQKVTPGRKLILAPPKTVSATTRDGLAKSGSPS